MKIFGNRKQTKAVEENFGKYMVNKFENSDSNITEREYFYCIIKLAVDVNLENKKIIESLLQKIIKAADETNGDVTNLCADSLVVLYGLPLPDPNVYENIESFIIKIGTLKSEIITILGREIGLYGRFGYEKRYIVTAIGRNLVKDFNIINSYKTNKIFIHDDVADKMLNLKQLESVEIIKG